MKTTRYLITVVLAVFFGSMPFMAVVTTEVASTQTQAQLHRFG